MHLLHSIQPRITKKEKILIDQVDLQELFSKNDDRFLLGSGHLASELNPLDRNQDRAVGGAICESMWVFFNIELPLTEDL